MERSRIIGVLFALGAVCMFVAAAAQPVLAIGKIAGIEGYVVDAYNGAVTPGIKVVDNVGHSTYTDVNGHYGLMEYAYGTYTVTAGGTSGFNTQSSKATLKSPDGYALLGFTIAHKSGGFYGRVAQEKGAAISGATVAYAYWLWGTYQRSLGSVTSDAYGWYWLSGSLGTGIGNTYSSTVTPPTGYWTIYGPMIYYYKPYTRQDFMCQSDVLVYVPLAAIYVSLTLDTNGQPKDSTATMSLVTGIATSTSVTVNVAGNGGSKQTTWGLTSTKTSSQGQISLIIKRPALITGIYSYITNEIVSSWVRSFPTTTVPDEWDYMTPDYWDYTFAIPPNTDTSKGGIQPVAPNGASNEIKGDDTSTTTFQYGLAVSFTAFGIVGVGVNCVGTATDTATNSLSVLLVNHDPTVTHNYKYYVEGDGATGGLVMHVWEMPT